MKRERKSTFTKKSDIRPNHVCLRFITCLLFASAAALQLYAQPLPSADVIRLPEDPDFLNNYVSRTWSSSDGLPSVTVTDLWQNEQGYIYAGTYDGLVRFDGIEFENYNRKTDPKYDFVSVRCIIQDSKGNLWVGHNDEGASCIKKDGTVVHYTTENGLPNNSVRAICEDKMGNIWFGTVSGLTYLTPDGFMISPTSLNYYDEGKIQVSSIYCDYAGQIWITTYKAGELFLYVRKTIKLYEGLYSFDKPVVNIVFQEKSGAMWYGVAPYYLVRKMDGHETVYDLSVENKTATVINNIYQDRDNNIWVSTDAGVSIIHDGWLSQYNKDNGLSDNKIIHIIEDKEGSIWLATDRCGIEKFSQSKFRTTPLNTSVNVICEDSVRDVTWLGTDEGLYCLNSDNEYIENKITQLCAGVRIRDVEMDSRRELLISTYTKLGQLCIDRDDNITSWTDADGLTGNKVRTALRTSNGDLYIATTTGLGVVSHITGKVTTFTKQQGIENEYIMALYEANDGSIWVGTDGGGIFVLKNGVVTKAYTSDNGLAGNVIFKIEELIKGELWITTGKGISRYFSDTDTFVSLNSMQGLGTDGIFQMVCDYTDNVWMTSNRGLLSVKRESLEDAVEGRISYISPRYYGKSDGIISGGVTSTSRSIKDTRGRVWITLIDGFAMYDPARAAKNTSAPNIEIQEYYIDNNCYEYTGEPIILPPSSVRRSIKYTGLSFISPEQIMFSYQLSGLEKSYSVWTSDRTVSYTNLKPGKYSFSVMSQNSDDVQSDLSDAIKIIKKPYIWQVPIFWIIVVILVLGVVAGYLAMKWINYNRTRIELERMVGERTHDLKLEKERSEKLLLNILPEDIAKELEAHPDNIIAKKYPKATVLFTDIVQFTKLSNNLTAEEVVTMLNNLVVKFDERAKKEGIEKIKTIGDGYMAATGLTEDENNDGPQKMVKFAQGLIQDLEDFNSESNIQLRIRIGINTGDLVAGVIGKSKFIYDIWGDTVNVASRMESTGEPGRIHVTEDTYNCTKDYFSYGDSIILEVKGKGSMNTYFVEG